MIHADSADVFWDGKIVASITLRETLDLINKNLFPLLNAKKELEEKINHELSKRD